MKDLFRGSFNLNRQVFVEYAYASSERQAWMVFCRRLAKKTGVLPRVTMGHFDGSRDNYKIQIEMKMEEVND